MTQETFEKIGKSIDDLRCVFEYDPESGKIIWKVDRSRFRKQVGTEAGSIWRDGYRYIRFDGDLFLAHRLAFALHFGRWPECVDHINMDRTDNRISNLREATAAENARNRVTQSNNQTGYKGVSYNKRTMKYCARISVDGEVFPLGNFDTAIEASNAYQEAAKKLHGEFAGREFRPFVAPPEESAFPERDNSRPAEDQGIFRKFDVRRLDGSSSPGGKHHNCRYFVLDLDHDKHAPAAMRAYAADCQATYPQLSEELSAEFGAVSAPAGVPDGMRLVPVEPTPEMLAAGELESDSEVATYETVFRAMLSAAPAAPDHISHPVKMVAPAGVPDFEPDAKRLALELECLLLECKDMAAVSKWWDSSHEALEQHRALLSADYSAPADAVVKDAEQWSPTAPTEQGWYWHWNGDADSAPVPTSVLYSGSTRSCFVSVGQLGISKAIDCAEYGGKWMRMIEPAIDAAMQGKESGK